MPELPEVETVRRGLAPAMEGAVVEHVRLARPDLRFPFPDRFAERIEGRRLVALGRRAKYLCADLDDGAVLVMHLGMSGSFRVEAASPGGDPASPRADLSAPFHHPRGKSAAHDHVAIELSSGARVVYNDPRRFGFMDLAARADLDVHPRFRDLGVEPTGNALSPEHLAAAFAGRATSLKAALLDQSVIAGLGNIYVCEALWRSGLSPLRAAGSIVGADGGPTAETRRLVEAIVAVIAEAIEAGGSSLRDHVRTDGSLGYFQHRFAVYDRAGEPCARPGCGGTVERIVQTGRSTFHCPVCQPARGGAAARREIRPGRR
ncbi:bifunctional DNA-formamidopyrimidine glycosylase/DNA-(apurinic or apyrimidinic site) lyase [Oharaeibacter diazotrophicus]|uniref:Formamidopyrimidine-DNA glycosylase n=1 Tax=Oharaeibacter diazotrophicus TaxID=1920512 RepID=A0A4R6R840_9HYPH|nr:bifunctional DNA-formamidopyrimidine glycosylase/DNA-(apurinic or apyrimidinic site) lyase [Oharaeibacter diazotrophicus]TDP82024.1 DNA-(apurinic or apyrimidinic site) lyase [Oharaeibacter diazotrophicus]BBE73656.1 formamidopyrimidine-DNA glycosylase [Pleomorphomonas sp. SM30]GLS75445.1 formamidopyrimidine-DNA glycosylase [Oharaeibacter diazotrophicus]